MAVTSTSADNNIPVAKTRVVSVFVTRFAANLNTDTLRSYLTDKLGKPVMMMMIMILTTRIYDRNKQ